MAEIFGATDTALGRTVAVKLLAAHHAEDAEIRARFVREGIAGARLAGQPHIVTIYDVGEYEGRPFLVMEYLGGGSLAGVIRKGPVPRAQALAWIGQAAAALDAAHARGIVHRDVKPANLLLDHGGNVFVADFGIASASGLESHTQTGVVLGTAGYLAPEQAAGERATAAADRYALAVVAHELLTGARPGTPLGAPLPPGADAVFTRALAERPDDRFDSCLAFATALREALEGDEAPTVVMRRRRSRRPVLVAGAAALGVLGAVLALDLSAHSGGSSPSEPRPVAHPVTATGPPRRPEYSPRPPVASGQPRSTTRRHGPPPHSRGHQHGKKAKTKAKASARKR